MNLTLVPNLDEMVNLQKSNTLVLNQNSLSTKLPWLHTKKSCKKKSAIYVKDLTIRAVQHCLRIFRWNNRVALQSKYILLVTFQKWYASERKLPKIGPPTRLDYEPAGFLIKRYIRYKYAPKNGEGVKIGQLPEQVIDRAANRKGIP